MVNKWFTFFILIILLFILISSILEMPPKGKKENPSYNHVTLYYIQNTKKDTFSYNIVNSIIADYRLFDTLGEMTVLFTAIVALLSILSKKHKKECLDGE